MRHRNGDHSPMLWELFGRVGRDYAFARKVMYYPQQAGIARAIGKHRGWKSICRELSAVLNFAGERRIGFCPVTKSSLFLSLSLLARNVSRPIFLARRKAGTRMINIKATWESGNVNMSFPNSSFAKMSFHSRELQKFCACDNH